MKLFKRFNATIFGISLMILFALLMLSFFFSLNVQPPKVVAFFMQVISLPTGILGLDSFFGFLMSKIVNVFVYAFVIERIIFLFRKKDHAV